MDDAYPDAGNAACKRSVLKPAAEQTHIKSFDSRTGRQISGGDGHEIEVPRHHFRQSMAVVFGPSVEESLGQFLNGLAVRFCLAFAGRITPHRERSAIKRCLISR
jgi:hypothetical protein